LEDTSDESRVAAADTESSSKSVVFGLPPIADTTIAKWFLLMLLLLLLLLFLMLEVLVLVLVLHGGFVSCFEIPSCSSMMEAA
jgi:hypothetical protein